MICRTAFLLSGKMGLTIKHNSILTHFIRLKKTEKYTAEYLSQFIDIEVLEQNSQNVYKYTADDFAKIADK